MQITLKGVTKRFGRTEALKEANLTIGDGEFFTLLGPSGCGKTTTLRVIAGFHTADEGDVLFDTQRVNNLPPSKRNIGIVFQNLALWPHMTVQQNIGYGLRLRHVPKAEAATRIAEVLEKVGLAGFGERFPGQLSGGQQQRVALARALVLNPGVLLLDEPLSSLDAKVRVRLRAEIRKLQQQLHITTVCVTHDQEEALTMSDRIAVMSEGRVLQVGTPRDLYERPTNAFVADFVGANNLAKGRFAGTGEGGLRVEGEGWSVTGLLAEHDLHPALGESMVAAFRPEIVTLVEEAPAGSDSVATGLNHLPGRVAFASYMGSTLRYEIEVAANLTVKVDVRDPSRHQAREVGSPVTLAFPVAQTLLLAGGGPVVGAPKVGEA